MSNPAEENTGHKPSKSYTDNFSYDDSASLHIEGHDMLDGTPVLDIKPYRPYADTIADATSGWLADVKLPDTLSPTRTNT